MPNTSRRSSGSIVFLDASVLVSAAMSSAGGSFRVIQEGALRGFGLVISPHVAEEACRALFNKRPELLTIIPELIATGRIEKVRDATQQEANAAADIIDPGDAPVLAAALASRSDFLLTLDRKDFFTPSVLAANLPTEIFLPGDFIRRFFY